MSWLKRLLAHWWPAVAGSKLKAGGDVEGIFSLSLNMVGQRVVSRWMILAEMIALPLLMFWIGLMTSPDDPLWMKSEFPWIWFGPVILALRYGPLVGLGSMGVVLLLWFAIGSVDEFPKLSFLGGFILVMVVGEFSSLWLSRTRRAETIQAYLGQRLESLTRQFYLLHLSHDRLEQDLIGRPMSMRDAISVLRTMGGDQEQLPENAKQLLRLLSQYCQLQTAAVFILHQDRLDDVPVAAMGEFSALNRDDPLLQEALRSGSMCHVGAASAETAAMTRYLIAAPLRNLANEHYGILLVEKMPFFALQDEILQTINLFLGYFTDGMTVGIWSKQLCERYPLCPEHFAFELLRLIHIRRSTGVSSIIVALEVRHQEGSMGVVQQILRMKRALDETWLAVGYEREVLATLMPLSNNASAEGYLARLETWAKQKSGKTLAEMGIFGHLLAVSGEPEDVIGEIMAIANLSHAD